MSIALGSSGYWRTISAIQNKDVRSLLFGKSLYVTLTLSFLIVAFIIRSYSNFIDEASLSVMAQPLYLPLAINVVITSVYLALVSCTSISRERDRGTLETLFYGPVNYTIYVLGKFLAHLLIYVLIVTVSGFFFFLTGWATGLAISSSFWWGLFLSLFSASCITAFGMLLSSVTSNVRTSLLVFLGALFFFGGIQVAHEMLVSLPVATLSGAVIYLRQILIPLNVIANWIFPISYLARGMEAVEIGSPASYSALLVSTILYTALLLYMTIAGLKWKGIRKR
jgi:ABC-type transport system involved in multi-copper enzyme maturation permease subunit